MAARETLTLQVLVRVQAPQFAVCYLRLSVYSITNVCITSHMQSIFSFGDIPSPMFLLVIENRDRLQAGSQASYRV